MRKRDVDGIMEGLNDLLAYVRERNAPVRTVRLTGMTDAEVWEQWNKTLGTNHPFPDDLGCDDDVEDGE